MFYTLWLRFIPDMLPIMSNGQRISVLKTQILNFKNMNKLDIYNDVMERSKDTFYVIGDSMTTAGSNSITPQCVITVKMLQKGDWTVKGWGLPNFRTTPFWVICTNTHRPILKQLVEYNEAKGYIVCSSLNKNIPTLRSSLKMYMHWGS